MKIRKLMALLVALAMVASFGAVVSADEGGDETTAEETTAADTTAEDGDATTAAGTTAAVTTAANNSDGDKDGSKDVDTGVGSVLVLGGIAALAGGAVVLSKKRK
jgi:LPXTG-motif cell wall-anchored protein